MIWDVFMWIFVALIAATVSTTTFALAKYEFNGWALAAWIAAIFFAINGFILANRTLTRETRFIFDDWLDATGWALCVGLRFVMFFTNDNERIEKE